MAAVYAVRRTSIGGFDKQLAMKVMLPQLCTDRQGADMFLDEARIAAKIAHPNVIQVLDVGEHEGLPFIVMEYLRGESLGALMKHAARVDDPIAIPVALAMVALVAEGLHAAHESSDGEGQLLGVVHRDISPDNIMVTRQGEVKVVDFGIAAARGRLASTRSGELRGKLRYVAPEQISKAPVDRRVDVWALGVVAWELLSGQSLFREDDEATTLWNVMNKTVPPIGERRPELPAEAARVVMQCLERDADERPESCAEVARVLHEVGAELDVVRRADLASELRRRFPDGESADVPYGSVPGSRDSEPAAPSVDPPGEPVTDVIAEMPVRAATRRRWLLPLVMAVGVSALATALWRSNRTPEAVVAAPSDTSIHLRIASDINRVLVAGVRHDERPVVFTLAVGASVEVELIGNDGRTERTRVTADDDQRLLALSPAPRPPSSLGAEPPASGAPLATGRRGTSDDQPSTNQLSQPGLPQPGPPQPGAPQPDSQPGQPQPDQLPSGHSESPAPTASAPPPTFVSPYRP